MKLNFKFLKIVQIILLLPLNSIFAQYTINDSALVRTTFLREFDKEVLNEYLRSDDREKINAALLSVSHSEDTTFIDSIIDLDFRKHGEYITFALGQLGESEKSKNYLLDLLKKNYLQLHMKAFDAIGKCGDSTTLNQLFELVDSSYILSSAGLPLAITNFHSRGITSDSSISTLLKNLEWNNCQEIISDWETRCYIEGYIGKPLSQRRFSHNDNIRLHKLELSKPFNTLYSIYRLGPIEETIPYLTKIANDDYYHQSKLYALGNFRKLKYFPSDYPQLKKLISSKSWRIRTETANAACYYDFSYTAELMDYLSLIDDENPNVSRTAATALKNVKFIRDRERIKEEIVKRLNSDQVTSNAKGELLISYQSLFNLKTKDLVNEYSDIIDPKYIYRLLTSDRSDWEFNYDYLSDRIDDADEVELLNLLPAYLGLQNKYLNEKEYAAQLFNVFKSNKPSSVSIIADGMELPIIHQYREVFQELILEQIFNNKNNPQFAETIISLANLAYKVDRIFYDSVIDMLSTSNLYSIKKFASAKQGIELNSPKNDNLFRNLWSSAFKYKFAEVETSKGIFKIELKPEFAPMTCGNFISLAEKGFYDGVIFHRVVPDFVIQTGDTTSTGWGGPGYEIVSEFSPKPYDRGEVGIASIGKDTEGSQWFVMHSIFPHLNGRYTNWGTVIEGMDVVDIIDEGDQIIEVKLSN